VLDHDAAIHDNMHTASLGSVGGLEVDDTLLHPEVRQAELKHLLDDGRDELGETEDVDDLGLDGKIGEAGVRFLAKNLGDGWIDGIDFVAVLLHIGRDIVAGLRRLLGEADDGDGAWIFFRRDADHGANEFWFVHFCWDVLGSEFTCPKHPVGDGAR